MIKFLAFKYFSHELFQTKFGRKWHGGSFFYMQTALPMFTFWDNVKFTNCQAVCLKEEHHTRPTQTG